MLAPVSPALLGLLGLVLVLTTGCGPSEREIAAARARHAAAADGLVVRQEPAAGGGLEQLKQDVELGVVVRREEGDDREGSEGEPLPGITLDVDQVDATGKSKRHWRVWADTAGLQPGGEVRSVHVLEDVDYAPGDGFQVEVRQEIPEAERAEYLEWTGEWAEDAAATSSGPTS
jgi:hypothetical protein